MHHYKMRMLHESTKIFSMFITVNKFLCKLLQVTCQSIICECIIVNSHSVSFQS